MWRPRNLAQWSWLNPQRITPVFAVPHTLVVALSGRNSSVLKNTVLKNMELISFQDFSKLRIRDFFPEGTHLFLDETGSTECAIGPAATEGLAFTYFAWRSDESRMTADVALDFREECPPEIGQRILDAIKLPLRRGMSLAAAQRLLGQPEYLDLSADGQGVVRFVCGEKCPYFVACDFIKDEGLTGIVVFRRDYWHPPE